LAFFVARFRVLILAAFAVALIFTAQPAPRVEAGGGAEAVIAYAMRQIGKPWRYGATGPHAFDCTGLVIAAFRYAGEYHRIGSGRVRSAAAFYSWFRSRGLTSRSGGRRGDLVVYGGGKHVGIYLGNGRVISTLVRGVTVHGLYAVTSGFTAFMHTRFSGGRSGGGGTAGSGSGNGGSAGSRDSKVKAKPASGTRYVKAYRLNFRAGPGTNYRIKSVLSRGAKLSVLASAHDGLGRTWFKVKTSSGKVGWVASWWTRR
jgi:cell wall-associated NlpC family hydrolase